MKSLFPDVFAAQLGNLQGGGDVATIQSLATLFTNILGVIVALAGVVLFIMFVVSGFSFLFSAGDPKKLEQARGTLTNAIVGLVVIVAAYLILKLIGLVSGYPDITKFIIYTKP
jgi:cytochrome bd-type quinol oxidase subunit 2